MFCLWEAFFTKWHLLLRIPVIFGLFFSGFISLVGGIFANPGGYGIGRASEWQQVADATRSFSREDRIRDLPDLQSSGIGQRTSCRHGIPRPPLEPWADYQPVEVKLWR